MAAIAIANAMVMTVLERTREIGIMKAVGVEPGTVRSMFLTESAFIGLFGGLVGLLLSVVGVVIGNYAFGRFVHSQNTNFNPGNLFQLTPPLIVFAIVIAIALSVIAGYFPSRRAVRLEALSALRYE